MVADLCLLDILVASELWGRNWHGWCVDAIEKSSEPRRAISMQTSPTPIERSCVRPSQMSNHEAARTVTSFDRRVVHIPREMVQCMFSVGDANRANRLWEIRVWGWQKSTRWLSPAAIGESPWACSITTQVMSAQLTVALTGGCHVLPQ